MMKNMNEAIVERVDIDNVSFIVYEPGNATRYNLVITRFDSDKKLGAVNGQERGLVISWPTYGSMIIPWYDPEPHPNYIEEKMKCYSGDAIALAKLINYLMTE